MFTKSKTGTFPHRANTGPQSPLKVTYDVFFARYRRQKHDKDVSLYEKFMYIVSLVNCGIYLERYGSREHNRGRLNRGGKADTRELHRIFDASARKIRFRETAAEAATAAVNLCQVDCRRLIIAAPGRPDTAAQPEILRCIQNCPSIVTCLRAKFKVW
jgi:hypothetical protein